jgi:hypothetical protein
MLILKILIEAAQRTDIVLGSTEPANYTSSSAAVSKEIVDMEIGMCQGAEQSDNTATAQ